jgi:hypothetical protein
MICAFLLQMILVSLSRLDLQGIQAMSGAVGILSVFDYRRLLLLVV